MHKQKYAISSKLSDLELKSINLSNYEVSFRRWLVGEVDRGHYTIKELSEKFDFNYHNFKVIFRNWQKRYSQKIYLSLLDMTPEELTQVKKLQERIEELEKQLDEAQLKNDLSNNIIDIAESTFKIEIRKKSGFKQ